MAIINSNCERKVIKFSDAIRLSFSKTVKLDLETQKYSSLLTALKFPLGCGRNFF